MMLNPCARAEESSSLKNLGNNGPVQGFAADRRLAFRCVQSGD